MNSKFTYFLILVNLLIVNGEDTQANCEIDTSNTGRVEYVCPPSPYSTKTSIHVYSELLIIDCNNTEVLDDTVLPRGNHNNIFKLVLKKCPLPAKGFKDLVNRFNITYLKELTFTLGSAANYTIEANELTGLEELDSLDLSESNILNLNGEIFKNTPNLSVLKINRNEIKLNENLFDNLQNLTDIVMFSNGIRTIPNNTFKKLTKLVILELWNNKIGNLKRGMFDGLKELKLLDLSKNQIQFIENDTFKDLTSLVYLSLDKNMISELTRKVFENCRNIGHISLKYNGLMFLRDDVFSQFHKLKVVYLSDNNLMEIPENVFKGSKNLREIYLSNNSLIRLENNVFRELENLEKLHIDINNLITLPTGVFSSLKNLEILHLQSNMINSIDQLLFKNMENLVEINLNYNRIVALDPNSLGYKPSLTAFSMSHNGFDFGSNKNIFLNVNSTPNLKNVDLSWNNISRYPNELNGILTIESVNMGHNLIKAIKVSSVLTKKELGNIDVVINLDSNKISSIQVNADELPITRNWRTIVTIKNNPIICDCHALSLAKFLQEGHNLDSCVQFKPTEIQCSGFMAGKILNDIKPSDLTCLRNSNCTSNRECACLSRSYDDSLIVNCSKRGLTDIPELISDESSKYDQIIVHLDGNRLKRSPGEHDGFGNVTELYLQQNQISNVTWVPTSLKVLKLSENALSYMNLGVLKLLNESKIENLSLGSNPWNCDCKASSFAEYLRSHINQIDSWDIKCNYTNKKLLNLSKKDLCPTNLELTLTLALPILFILLLITLATTLYFKYKKEILIWLYGNGLFLCLFEEDEIDEDKIYDAFISYSHKDEDFVTDNIISTLESGEQPYKLCIHVRDFIPGELIHSQILNSVKSSRRTIVILSTSFLESVWGKLEFKTAHTEAMLEGRARVIIIVYGDIDLNNLDDDLKAYIKTNTYVEWGDPWFWKKLRYALPKRSKKGIITSQKHANMMQFINDKFHLMKRNSNFDPVSTPPIILDPSKIEEKSFTCIA